MLIKPLVPRLRRTGRPRTTYLRDVFDAILYVATTDCQWRMLPNDFPPVSTVRGYFYAWRNDGLLDEMNRELLKTVRLAEGRHAHPTAGVQDRDGALDVLKAVAARCPMLRHVFADGGSAGPKLRDTLKAVSYTHLTLPTIYSV